MDEWTLNDLLECSVCLERLDTSSKVLPCQHTFCKKCLEEIVYTHKELRCPECRVLVDIGIDELPPNVLLMRILEGMKNAPRRAATATESVSVANHSKSSVSSAFSSTCRVRSRSTSRPGSHYMPDPLQPYAIAKRDCVSKEPGDLSFKRGDLILLRRKVEHNWYQGECNGVLGVFPLSYVQVVVPLPSHTPQCKALYDFGKSQEDEDGCLHFSKGDVITVMRRVDENWAEGKLDDRIGIFPISFVEMNYFAKNLMKTIINPATGISRDAPPTPTDDASPLLKEKSNPVSNLLTQNVGEGLTSFSPSSSSSTTSTATTSPTSSSESTTPSSPSTSPSAGPLAQVAPIKRHSYTPGAQPPPYHAPPAVHRHSVEIFKPDERVTEQLSTEQRSSYQIEPRSRHHKTPPQTSSHHSVVSPGVVPEETPTRVPYQRRKTQSELPITETNREPQSMSLTAKQTNGNTVFQRQSSLRIPKSTSVHSKLIEPPALPAMYIAIYQYKPQKTDELELKIGSVYTVIERCQDGWFKGTSHPNPKCGVFPGNYVTPVKSLPTLQAQLKGLVHSSNISPRPETRVSSDSRVTSSTTKSTSISAVSTNNSTSNRLAPPELPPRSLSPHLASHTSQKVSSSTWHLTTCGVLEKSASSSSSSASKARVGRSNGMSADVLQAKWKSVEKGKEKKEKASVSLMRRLTSMKKSRSPPPPSTYSIDNPVFDEGVSSTFVPVTHARSDSCPSQLSYSTQSHATSSSSNHHANLVGGSQRVKHKQRSSLQNQFTRTFDNNTVFSSSSATKIGKDDKAVISHRKSSSLDTTVYGERETEHSKNKPVDPPPRERYQCIAPYPPNSDYELELRVGDIIYVHKKRDDGWYRGTLTRNGRTGLFPVSFVEKLQ